MRKATCPQCQIPNLYIKNSIGEILPIYVTTEGEIIPKREGDSLQGYDTETIYCFGCSWSGSLASLIKRSKRA